MPDAIDNPGKGYDGGSVIPCLALFDTNGRTQRACGAHGFSAEALDMLGVHVVYLLGLCT